MHQNNPKHIKKLIFNKKIKIFKNNTGWSVSNRFLMVQLIKMYYTDLQSIFTYSAIF